LSSTFDFDYDDSPSTSSEHFKRVVELSGMIYCVLDLIWRDLSSVTFSLITAGMDTYCAAIVYYGGFVGVTPFKSLKSLEDEFFNKSFWLRLFVYAIVF
jgi:hypothetical protein